MNLAQTKPSIASSPSGLIFELRNKVSWLGLDTNPHEIYTEDHFVFIGGLLDEA